MLTAEVEGAGCREWIYPNKSVSAPMSQAMNLRTLRAGPFFVDCTMPPDSPTADDLEGIAGRKSILPRKELADHLTRASNGTPSRSCGVNQTRTLVDWGRRKVVYAHCGRANRDRGSDVPTRRRAEFLRSPE